MEGRNKNVAKTAGLEVEGDDATAENEYTLPNSNSERKPPNSLLGRRNTGNNLYIKIPSAPRESESGDSSSSPSPSDADEEGEVETAGSNMSNYRRNSISMPVLNTMDLDVLRQLHEQAVQEKMNSIDNASSVASSQSSIPAAVGQKQKAVAESSDEDERPAKQMMFRTKRRSSIAPLPALRLNDKDLMANELDTHSIVTQNSVTSISSLASLLKEKLLKVPTYIRKKREKTQEFKVKAFVAFLFLLIVFLISYAYIMYDYKVLSMMYFERVKFSQPTRSLKIFDEDKKTLLLRGQLGLESNLGPKPVRCQTEDLNELCFEWGKKAKLFLSETELDTSINCYNVRWEPQNDNVRALDCYRMEQGVHWFGGGLTRDLAWPLEEGSGVPLSPFVTGGVDGREEYSAWGNAVRRYFINSNGIAIEIADESPLYVSINANRSQEFCLKSRYDDYAFVNRLTKYPVLAYRICSAGGGGQDMLSLHRRLTQKSLWDGLRENEVNLLHTLIEEPVWQVTDPTAASGGSSAITLTTVERYTDGIIAMGFAPHGHVLFDEGWQKNAGDFAVDEERFGQFGEMVEILQRRGFKVALTVQPLISTKSPMFAEAVERQLLITERKSEGTVPALTRFKTSSSVGVLDVTKEETITWWLAKLNRLVEEYKVNGFYLDLGSASTMPRYYQTHEPLLNPDDYKRILMQKLDGVLNIIGISSAVQVPEPPTLLSLFETDSSWKGLRRTLISALSSSVLGYPFLMTNTIGGDIAASPTTIPVAFLNGTTQLPDEELFIRWLQLASFLPGMRFSYLPSHWQSGQVMEVAKELFTIRSKYTIPLFRKYLSDAINDASQTLIRPLWMLDAADSTCYYVQDEFAVGPEIIVAPVLEQGQRQREVYLPFGVWKDGIDGSLRKGSRWLHNYQVPLDKVAYFIKMPDNTRF